MSNESENELTKYILEDLSNSSDIDKDDYELRGEDEQGRDACYDTTIQEIARRALDRIIELECELDRLHK